MRLLKTLWLLRCCYYVFRCAQSWIIFITANPECRVSQIQNAAIPVTDEPNLLATTSRIHTSASAITIAAGMRHRQNAVLLLRHRHRKSGMPRVVTITDDRNLSKATWHIHASAGAATIAIQLASKRDIAKAIQQTEFGAMRLLLSNTRASDVTAAAAGIK